MCKKSFPDWVFIEVGCFQDTYTIEELALLVANAVSKQVSAVVLTTVRYADSLATLRTAIDRHISQEWKWTQFIAEAARFGSPIQAKVKCSILAQDKIQDVNSADKPGRMADYLRPQPDPVSDGVWRAEDTPNPAKMCGRPVAQPVAEPGVARVVAFLDDRKEVLKAGLDGSYPEEIPWSWPIFDSLAPAPPMTQSEDAHWNDAPFLVQQWSEQGARVRPITAQEIFDMVGISEQQQRTLAQMIPPPRKWYELSNATPAHALARIMEVLRAVEDAKPRIASLQGIEFHQEASISNISALLSVSPNDVLTPLGYPLPDMEAWKTETSRDPDLRKVIDILSKRTPIVSKEASRGWKDITLLRELQKDRLILESGLVYRYEAKVDRALRQLRTLVVPVRLRYIATAACHVSPMAGHVGTHKTFWRVATRFWWPQMAKYVDEHVKGCAHCRLANIASHEAQQKLKCVESDAPFDVMAFDVWKPGRFPSTLLAGKSKRAKALLTGIDIMTGFASAGLLEHESSEEIARVLFTQFVISYGLPMLIIIDAGSEFAGRLIAVCLLLKIKHQSGMLGSFVYSFPDLGGLCPFEQRGM